MKSCRNCRKIFSAKNALFCSTSCYEFYTNALEKNAIVSSEKYIESNDSVLKISQTNCNHEYSKNGSISCRKCGHISF